MTASSPYHFERLATEGETPISAITSAGSKDDSGGSIKTSGESSTDNNDLTIITGVAEPSIEANPTSAPGTKSIPLDLNDAILGNNAELAKAGNITAIVMRPPANGSAYFDLAGFPDTIPDGQLVRFLATITVSELDSQSHRSFLWRRETTTNCSLQILKSMETLYNERVLTTDINKYIISKNFEYLGSDVFEIRQHCGYEPVNLTFAGPVIEDQERNVRGADKASIVGPVVGGIVPLLFLIGGIYLFRRIRAKRASPKDTSGLHEKPQLHSDCISRNTPAEVESQVIYEMEGSTLQPAEMTVNEVPARELPI